MYHKWTQKEIEYLKNNIEKYTNKEFSYMYKVSMASIANVLKRQKRKRKTHCKEIVYIVTKTGCHECTSHKLNRDGYPSIFYKGKVCPMSHYIYEKYNNIEIPEGLIIRHTCDNPACISPKHLLIGTRIDNVKDRDERNRTAKGNNHFRSKLNEKQVKEIRIKLEQKILVVQIAKEYNINKNTVYSIKYNKNWKHI